MADGGAMGGGMGGGRGVVGSYWNLWAWRDCQREWLAARSAEIYKTRLDHININNLRVHVFI